MGSTNPARPHLPPSLRQTLSPPKSCQLQKQWGKATMRGKPISCVHKWTWSHAHHFHHLQGLKKLVLSSWPRILMQLLSLFIVYKHWSWDLSQFQNNLSKAQLTLSTQQIHHNRGCTTLCRFPVGQKGSNDRGKLMLERKKNHSDFWQIYIMRKILDTARLKCYKLNTPISILNNDYKLWDCQQNSFFVHHNQ